MKTTISIRLTQELREDLKERANQIGWSLSQYAEAILEGHDPLQQSNEEEKNTAHNLVPNVVTQGGYQEIADAENPGELPPAGEIDASFRSRLLESKKPLLSAHQEPRPTLDNCSDLDEYRHKLVNHFIEENADWEARFKRTRVPTWEIKEIQKHISRLANQMFPPGEICVFATAVIHYCVRIYRRFRSEAHNLP